MEQLVAQHHTVAGQKIRERLAGRLQDGQGSSQREDRWVDHVDAEAVGARFGRDRGIVADFSRPGGDRPVRLELVEESELGFHQVVALAVHRNVAPIHGLDVSAQGVVDHDANELQRDDDQHADSDAEDGEDRVLTAPFERPCGVAQVHVRLHLRRPPPRDRRQC